MLLGKAWVHAVLVALSFLMVLPFVWMVMTSLKSGGEVESGGFVPAKKTIVDEETGATSERRFLVENYSHVNDHENPNPNKRGVQYARSYWNSIYVGAWITFLQVVTSSMAAYSFARLKWRGRDTIFLMYLGTMMLPGLVMMIPNYEIMIQLGLVDTLIGLILPASFGAFGTFLLRQFMLSIPASLDEAAEIDGCSKWQIFSDIILPLARPGLITLTIFTFIGTYNSFFWPLIMLKQEANYTLPISLMFFDSTRGQSTHLLMAAVTMSIVPMVILFVALQKYLVKGIQIGAVKG
ncbi:MAG TPA: carbohydrate ABC transporter permease [Tepidisphaeraceae bacterium]|nr:carbohydrate ABC transporter permease [Tepidisphaeraceae bacterium]